MRVIVRYILFCVIFGSMWAHGTVVFADEHHHMGDPSCLEHCLDRVQAQSVGSGVVLPTITFTSVMIEDDLCVPSVLSGVFACIDSHHDPGRILTTIKRE